MQGVGSEAIFFQEAPTGEWGQDAGKEREEGAVMSRLTLRLISPGDPGSQ